ncbi:MAG: hypothetical protein HY569_01070 [Candidatus Magasanikbacteria bacterium]|nr:hypothetical protein [Candidatus Magasanikbacteria bacterium]
MDRFHNEWGEAKNFRSRKHGESDYVPVEEIPDEGNDPESLLIAREENTDKLLEESGGLIGKKVADIGDEKSETEEGGGGGYDLEETAQSSKPGVGLRKAAALEGLEGGVKKRRKADSERRGKGAKLNKPARDRRELQKAA